MREILFRGKRKDNGEWVEGYLSLNNQITFRVSFDGGIGSESVWIIPETVGQYTGLLDKNGKKIFEGDIIERRLLPTKRICTKSTVKFADRHAAFSINDINGTIVESYLDDINHLEYEIEVIGTIHDNPELLQE